MLRERVRNRPRDPSIRYAELSRRVGRFHRDPVFLSALGLVSYRSLIRDGYALSALVVNESGRPGASFYAWVVTIISILPTIGGTSSIAARARIRISLASSTTCRAVAR
jgi:hypothetical protein